MSKRFNLWMLILAAVLVSRFIGMVLLPLSDTTEPRYAEIARLMAETGDWITPWFEPGVPFWGKPPLSFWAQAGAINIFGVSEFSLRFPSWLATIAMIGLIWRLARQLWNLQVAQWSSLVFATMALTYISSGAVMTDAFLALGTTLSLVSFCLVMSGKSGLWRWLFFLGLAIGFLSKGPLAIVLVGIPIVLWLSLWREAITNLRRLPWLRGILMTALLVCPWYLLAELKTPGFLDYFIVGEHIRRFLDPGWAGDLYGNAHDQPKGMIWVFWLWASFPWGIVALVCLVLTWFRGTRKGVVHKITSNAGVSFLLISALAPMLFFTLAGNTLWTYILPSLPFTAILIGRWVSRWESLYLCRMRGGIVALVPVLLTVFVSLTAAGWAPLKTEKELVNYYQLIKEADDSPLIYLNDLPFSARFYSGGNALEVTQNDLKILSSANRFKSLYVAIPRDWSEDKVANLSSSALKIMENKRYQLLVIEGLIHNKQPVSNANGVR
ncbi:MAG: phospholipid carrier-dependent glycosyltransferase [Porticoccus sp.]|jgi:4-amino-4-deoxy-L-arabinose transferase-like glycosyltransferase|uniref:ArnT family glycosyltransferase n=1 Tax=Porticoccus TaxID=1123967 RepID=UPI00055C10DC|nr:MULTISPECIES: glycosyltransferase family 39 protein [Porticoccus]MAZ70437.1 phospholipid carrier-dependent glycosyltransferase [Porticoccus sp.]MBG58502.1 phospholipid carrier-dependent glycosyltransferase [Porticoccus sp.]|tara:strand:+ start:11019 stop:12503 length:1485 start_codon:yes stop_codon:yes gene_type:complete